MLASALSPGRSGDCPKPGVSGAITCASLLSSSTCPCQMVLSNGKPSNSTTGVPFPCTIACNLLAAISLGPPVVYQSTTVLPLRPVSLSIRYTVRAAYHLLHEPYCLIT